MDIISNSTDGLSINSIIDFIEKHGYVVDLTTICFGENLYPYYQVFIKKWTKDSLTLEYKTPYYLNISDAFYDALQVTPYIDELKEEADSIFNNVNVKEEI